MEKKEARIKCTACGAKFKVKIPVTDRPVSFTCRKCGKVLKLRLKSESQPVESLPSMPPAGMESSMPEFETTQLPDNAMPMGEPTGPSIVSAFDELGESASASRQEETPGSMRTGIGWLVLMGEQVTGPYKSSEIMDMVKNGAIRPDTSIRMGERPWVQAVQVPDLRRMFPKEVLEAYAPDEPEEGEEPTKKKRRKRVPKGKPFYEDLRAVASYPVAKGNYKPLAIFAGVAFVLSVVLHFSFLIGLPLNIAGWIFLYGYLITLMDESTRSSENGPPDWEFSSAGEMMVEGAKVFAVMALLSLIPVTILIKIMIVGYLNGFSVIGFIAMSLVPVLFAVSLCFVPGGLIRYYATQRVGAAINPAKLIGLVTSGGKPYAALMLFSIVLGLVCMKITIISVFLNELPGLGFIIAGLLMAVVLTPAHFVWFHIMGRFIKENKQLLN